METEKYLSIKKFAETAHVSTQAIYSRVSKDLKPYVKFEGNKKMISNRALTLFATKQPNKQSTSQPTCTTACNQIDNQKENENVIFKLIKNEDDPETPGKKKPVFEVMLLSLKNQLEIKDIQLKEKDKQLESLTKALLNAQLGANQAQALHAETIKQIAIEESTCATNCTTNRKQGFFSKLFKKRV